MGLPVDSTLKEDAHAEDEAVFLTLGDGDFTYSLDLARFLANKAAIASTTKVRKVRLIASGIDSLNELTAKYRDTPFVLGKLQSLNDVHSRLSVQVLHEVNAIDASDSRIARAHHVIFNHPHLGTEDAQLHARFLRHLFHTVRQRWLAETGTFHLTLAAGQFERWKCDGIADWQLASRNEFVPPPVNGTPYYQHRRHQTGRSFASRVPGGSETFTFVPAATPIGQPDSLQLDWYKKSIKDASPTDHQKPDLTCPYCDKTFREARSVKNHIRSKHDDDATGKKRKRKIPCPHCQPGEREFETEQALQDHIKAKHAALHSDLTPDWCRTVTEAATKVEKFGESCLICGQVFATSDEKTSHLESFLPKGGELPCNQTFGCDFCARTFSELRAKRQHENSCRQRPVPSSGPNESKGDKI